MASTQYLNNIPQQNDNFDWLFNQNTLDESFDEAIQDQSKIDEELW
ncbi:MAG TPA: hypothetical protein VH234_03285 [Candidatus Saccharimonadales bacterium]|nr:hypothetical protein [Candidatus Saccharimonadales bacterium]